MTNYFANRYDIQRELGRGAFGVVYLAHDLRLRNRPVALKILHPVLSTDPGVVRLFQNEAGVLATLQHDHIVTVHDADVWQDRRYIVMAFVDGPSLAQVVQEKGAQPPEQVAQWLRQAASALAYAHEHGVLHRDVKSANLLLDRSRNRLVVTDFGLAQAAEASGGTSYQTNLGVLTGTAAYRAPEVVKTGHTVASDLYSLGVVTYELLAGRLPFESGDPLSLMMLHASEPPPPLAESTPPDLVNLVTQLLAKKPEERPTSAGVVVEVLAAPLLQTVIGAEAQPLVQPNEPVIPPLPVPEVVAQDLAPVQSGEPVNSPLPLDEVGLQDQPPHQLSESVAPSPLPPVVPPESPTVARPPGRLRSVWPLLVVGVLAAFVVLLLALRNGDQVPAVGSVVATNAATSVQVASGTNIPQPIGTPTRANLATPTYSYKSTPVPDAYVNATTVNLRAGPGTAYDRLGSYPRNAAIEVVGKNATGDWLKVETTDGKIGWMATALLQVNGPLDQATLVDAPPGPSTAADVGSRKVLWIGECDPRPPVSSCVDLEKRRQSLQLFYRVLDEKSIFLDYSQAGPLSQYDAIIIDFCPFPSEETLKAVRSYFLAGGSVVIQASNACLTGNVYSAAAASKFTKEWGINYSTEDNDHKWATDFEEHPITEGVARVFVIRPVFLDLIAPAQSVVRIGNDTVIAVYQAKGKLVVIGAAGLENGESVIKEDYDEGTKEYFRQLNQNKVQSDNFILWGNLFDWLVE